MSVHSQKQTHAAPGGRSVSGTLRCRWWEPSTPSNSDNEILDTPSLDGDPAWRRGLIPASILPNLQILGRSWPSRTGKASTTISERLNMARPYDPLNAPDPDDWQSIGEDERMMLVMEYHREAGVELPRR